MSDLSVSERRIRPIHDAITAGNWKQALQLCDKWQKKGEKSDRFLALKASVLVHQPDKPHHEKGKAETLQLCRRNVPVTDIEAIYQLQESLKNLALYEEEGPKLWERATATLPNDKEFLTTWLNGSISETNWLVAQKSAMALRKAFPKERQYEFLNILLCYLIHRDGRLPEKDRMLFGTLAYRMISKAAELVPNDKTQLLSPGKAIATPEELALLTKIYISTGHETDAIVLLQSENLGLMSKVAEQDPQMVFSLLIEALDSSQNHNLAFQICQKMLTANDTHSKAYAEDDRIWRTIGRAAQANDDRLLEPCLEIIETVLQNQPTCREVHLARLELLTYAVGKNNSKESDLLAACQQHIKAFENKPFCFSDVVNGLKACKTDIIQDIIGRVDSKDASEAQQMLGLKLDYSILSESDSTDIEFLGFAAKAIKVHKSLPKQKTECPEAALLAALALIRLAAKTQDTVFALQASFILESSCLKHAEYYPSAVRLVQLHRALGSMSLAMDRFGSLSVKNIQWETVGHLLLTRISSLHPLQCNIADSNLSPLGAFDAGLNMLLNAGRSLDQQIKQGLEYGSYSNVLDSVSVKHNIEVSLNRQVFGVEERKIQTLVGMPVDTILDEHPTQMVDQRDFTFLETYNVENSGLDTFLNCGPLPQNSWLDVMATWDHIAMILRSEASGRTVEAEKANVAFTKIWATLDGNTRADLTDAEASSNKCHRAIGGVLFAFQHTAKEQQTGFDENLKKITSWLEDSEITGVTTINNLRLPSWKFIHLCFTRLQTVHTLGLLVTFLSRKAKVKSTKGPAFSKDKVVDLQKAAVNAEEQIHQWAKNLKGEINAPGVLGRLIEVISGRLEGTRYSGRLEYRTLAEELAGMYDEAALEEYCGKIKDSWEEALDGIVAIKTKISK